MDNFIQALRQKNLEKVRAFPKSDLHNHFVLGASRAYLGRSSHPPQYRPSNNVLLGRVSSMADHPIGPLYRSGVDVTINSDDILIFDSDVSKEYLRLYGSGCLSAEELDSIRHNGLQAR